MPRGKHSKIRFLLHKIDLRGWKSTESCFQAEQVTGGGSMRGGKLRRRRQARQVNHNNSSGSRQLARHASETTSAKTKMSGWIKGARDKTKNHTHIPIPCFGPFRQGGSLTTVSPYRYTNSYTQQPRGGAWENGSKISFTPPLLFSSVPSGYVLEIEHRMRPSRFWGQKAQAATQNKLPRNTQSTPV